MSSVGFDGVIEGFRSRLLARRAELLSEIAGRPEELLHVGALAEDDKAPVLHNQFVSLEMNRIMHSQLKLIDAALIRLDVGEYGICEHCDGSISPKRLRALPWARYCITCEEAFSTLVAVEAEIPSAVAGAPIENIEVRNR
jgi:DnaK suppressor protein